MISHKMTHAFNPKNKFRVGWSADNCKGAPESSKKQVWPMEGANGDANIPTEGKGLEEERRLDVSRRVILKRLLTIIAGQ
jgi:hypothetical protein